MTMFDYNKIKNPEIFMENRLPAHSDHEYYKDDSELLAGSSSFKYVLNGLWKFAYAKNLNLAVKGFEAADYSAFDWDTIHVPAHIQMEGYDVPQYANVQYPWDGREQIDPGEIPTDFNPVAHYVKYFNLPVHFREKRTILSFQGVESGAIVWLNGNYIGYSEDSFTPAEFDVSEHLVEGMNKLAVQVIKWTAGSWCEDQDFFRFSGIFRDVFLYCIPEVHIRDLKICTPLTEDFKQGKLELEMDVIGEGSAKISLYNGDNPLFLENITLSGITKASQVIEEPRLWSAESPALYHLEIRVFDKSGTLQEIIPYDVGFRKFEIRDSIMHLNGKRIVFKGVNRHEFSSIGGRHVTREELIQDIITMKKNNINAIRTCHYPDDSAIYKLCDQYGLYMIDETNLETHGSWDAVARGVIGIEEAIPGDRPEWKQLILDRANSMYQRDKNHVSILIWSCGNESFGGSNLFEMSEFFRKVDSTRPVHYEGVHHDRRYNGTSDIESQMYTPADEIRKFLQNDRRKPFICCEYLHAMGNSCGAMHKYTDLTDTEPLYQGGFIWDYIDQSILKKDRYGKEFQAYGGDFDDRPCDYNFCGNGIVYADDRTESPKMQEVKYHYQNISIKWNEKTFTIVNKNLFTSTDQYECRFSVNKDGKQIEKKVLQTNVGPLQEAEYPIPEIKIAAPGIYSMTVSFHLKTEECFAAAGFEVAFGEKIIQVNNHEGNNYILPDGLEDTTSLHGLKVIKGKLNIGVKGDHFEALFSYLNGGLVSYRYAGKEMIKAIPKPNFWRAPTDNDYGNQMPARYGQWKLASLYMTHKNGDDAWKSEPELVIGKDMVTVSYRYYLPTVPASECLLIYTVHLDGSIKVRLEYEPDDALKDMPEFGVIMKIDADYDRLEWLGMGPQETYADRRLGAKFGLYQNKVLDNMARYLLPQECGNKTGVKYAKVMDAKGRGMIFYGTEMNFSALPYTPHEIENAQHPYELPPIHYTVIRASLMQMGIAGDDSWGAKTHEEYLIPTDHKLVFEFFMKGI